MTEVGFAFARMSLSENGLQHGQYIDRIVILKEGSLSITLELTGLSGKNSIYLSISHNLASRGAHLSSQGG